MPCRFRFGDEGHPNHHPRMFGELGTLGARIYGPSGKFPYKRTFQVRKTCQFIWGEVPLTYSIYVPLYNTLYKLSAAN